MLQGCALVSGDLGAAPIASHSWTPPPPGHPLTLSGPADVVPLYEQVPRALGEAVQQQELEGGRDHHHCQEQGPVPVLEQDVSRRDRAGAAGAG